MIRFIAGTSQSAHFFSRDFTPSQTPFYWIRKDLKRYYISSIEIIVHDAFTGYVMPPIFPGSIHHKGSRLLPGSVSLSVFGIDTSLVFSRHKSCPENDAVLPVSMQEVVAVGIHRWSWDSIALAAPGTSAKRQREHPGGEYRPPSGSRARHGNSILQTTGGISKSVGLETSGNTVLPGAGTGTNPLKDMGEC